MSFFRDAIEKMEGYTPGEQPQASGYIKLNTNENPYPPCAGVEKLLKDYDYQMLRLYPDPMATKVRKLVAKLFDVESTNVLIGNGSDDLLTMIMRAFVGEGESITYPVPTYSLYPVLAQIQGARVEEISFNEDFTLPEGLFGNTSKVTIVANPNAPSGTAVDNESLGQLARSIEGVLVIDEAYADFENITAAELVKEYNNVIVIRTLSKSYSLAGVRIGYAIAEEGLITGLAKVKDSYNVSRLSIEIAYEALADQGYMRYNAQRIVSTRNSFVENLEKIGIYVYPSRTNFVLARFGYPRARELYERLKERKILVRYFDGDFTCQCLRITVGFKHEMDALFNAICEILDVSV